MNAAVVCLAGLAVFALGYRYYSAYLSRRLFDLRDDEPVPSRELEDGVDYVPTNKHVLFGHHYSSIAGAAPIIGPAIAVVWGGSLYRIALLHNRYVSGLVAVGVPLLLVLAGKAGALWPLFGASNQLLAGLSLTVVTVWLYRLGRPWLVVAVPMVIVMIVSVLAMLGNLGKYVTEGQYVLATIGAIILALQAWVVIEGLGAVRGGRGRPAAVVTSE